MVLPHRGSNHLHAEAIGSFERCSNESEAE